MHPDLALLDERLLATQARLSHIVSQADRTLATLEQRGRLAKKVRAGARRRRSLSLDHFSFTAAAAPA